MCIRTTYIHVHYTQTKVLSIRSLCAYTFHFSSKSYGRQDGEDDTDGEADTSDRLERSLSFLADRCPCGAGTRSARVRELRKNSAERPAHRHCVRESYYPASCRQKREAEGEQDKATRDDGRRERKVELHRDVGARAGELLAGIYQSHSGGPSRMKPKRRAGEPVLLSCRLTRGKPQREERNRRQNHHWQQRAQWPSGIRDRPRSLSDVAGTP